jgi:pimeloyl-ACP methyl ester carboxylesterase
MQTERSYRPETLSRPIARIGRLATFAMMVAIFWCGGPKLAISAGKEPAKQAGKKADKEEEKIPKPEDLVIDTSDGIQLSLTYYAGLKGKQSIPIVLLHGWKQSRSEFKELAPALQSLGYAVIVPDLRGHGESKRIKGERPDDGLEAAKMPPVQFRMMVEKDMKAIKDFLWEKNNAEELNLDKLCVVGAEMGASVALNFAMLDAVDQDRNRVNRPGYKLGHFVKALVLISPELSFRGLPIREAATYPPVQHDIAILILVGKRDRKAAAEAGRIYGLFKSSHPEPTGEDKIEKQTLFFGKLDTSLEGTKLLDAKFNVQGLIADFVERRLVKSDESKQWGWKERKYPYE